MAFSKEAFQGLLIDGVKPTGKILGKGAYGKVIEVTWNGTVCAAKQVHEVFLDEVSPTEKARVVRDFQREFQTWAKLRHPNIVILLGVYFISGSSSPQIVLEKMDTSLRNYLEKHARGDFPLVHKVDVLKQIAQGLSYLHSLNPPLVHHDLSPNNVLLNEVSFTTKLTDFGMTRAVNPSALTRMSSIKGTLAFMAPEALRNKPRYDDKLDTFSFGNIIISTVTHEWPNPGDPNRYEGEKLIALTEYQRREEYMKLFSVEESKLLSDVVQRCLENRPERRPSSVILVDELDVVSKSFVPGQVWVEQVLELKQDKQQLATRVTELQGDIVRLQEDQVHLQEHNQQLASRMTVLQGDIVRLQECKVHLQQDKQQLGTKVTVLQGVIVLLQEDKLLLQQENEKLLEKQVSLKDENASIQKEKESMQKALEQEILCLKASKPDEIPRCPPDVETQLEEIRPLLDARLQENDFWYLVDVRWMKQWKKYVGFDSWDRSHVGDDSANPGPLDSSNLLLGHEDETLKDHLMEDLDYSLIPERAWDKLSCWYGITDGSKTIARKAIEWGMYVKNLKVEVYPIRLELGVHPLQEGKTVTRTFSRVDKMSTVKDVIIKEFDLPEDKTTRLWHRYMTSSYELVKDDDMLQESGIYTGQLMILEVKKADGTWPRDTYTQATMNTTRSTHTAGASGSSGYFTRSSSGSGGSSSLWGSYGRETAEPGLCGLQNLENTSFMNSVLQCLSNTEQLTDYFLSKAFLKHVNKKNPLGMGGQLANAFGGLLGEMWTDKYSYTAPRGFKSFLKHVNKKNPLGMGGLLANAFGVLLGEMWTDKYSYTAPRGFKSVIGKHAPQFVGNAQHDSKEFLAFLLDGLHEDLNQVRDKPYVDMSINNKASRTDGDIAKETWEKYLLRNRSVIVNLFQGQLKSTLVCPDCEKVSRVFDPFMYLSLPLPIEKTRWLTMHLVRLDPAAVVEKYKLKLPKQGRIADLQQELSKLSEVDSFKMVTIDVYQHRFHWIYEKKEGLNHILDRDDIFVYEVPIISANDPDWIVVPVYHREHYTKTYSYSYSGGAYTQSYTRLFGLPLLVTVRRQDTTYQDLYDAVMKQCVRYVKRPCDVKDVQGNEDNVESKKEDKPSKEDEPKMFEITAVNGYGSQTLVRFEDDGSPLKLGGNVYIGCDWDESWKDRCYDEDKSMETVDHESMKASVEQQKKRISITDCIELFTSAEKLGEDDPWYCPHCKDSKQATKKFDLWKLPEILVVHLNRFSYNRDQRNKLDFLVDFPLELDLRDFVVNENNLATLYELYAVTNHYDGLGGGHYTAFAMNYENGKWYNFDDSHVSETDSSHVVTSAAYVLFFRRKDTKSLRKSLSMDQSCVSPRILGEDEPDEVIN